MFTKGLTYDEAPELLALILIWVIVKDVTYTDKFLDITLMQVKLISKASAANRIEIYENHQISTNNLILFRHKEKKDRKISIGDFIRITETFIPCDSNIPHLPNESFERSLFKTKRNSPNKNVFIANVIDTTLEHKQLLRAQRQPIPPQTKDDLWKKRMKTCCFCCDKTIRRIWYNENFQDDAHRFEYGHVLSVAHGGTNDIDNLRLICYECNRTMSSMHLEEFLLLKYEKNASRKLPKVRIDLIKRCWKDTEHILLSYRNKRFSHIYTDNCVNYSVERNYLLTFDTASSKLFLISSKKL